MTPTLEDLDQRLTAVEERLDEQSGLRASQDRDLSDIAEGVRTHRKSIQALRKTQAEHTQKLDHLTGRVDQLTSRVNRLFLNIDQIDRKADHLTGRVDQLDGKVEQITATVAEVQGGVTQIVGMLDTLIAREDER